MATDNRDLYIEMSVEAYLQTHEIKITDIIDSESSRAREIRGEILESINDKITLANEVRGKGNKIRAVDSLPGYAVARILIATGDVKRLALGTGRRIISKRYFKNSNGENEWTGTYEVTTDANTDSSVMRALSLLVPDATSHDEHSMMRYLVCNADSVTLQTDNKLVFFRNGVFNFADKTLTEYTDADYDAKYGNIISLAKLPVYHPLGKDAKLAPDASGALAEPTITNPDGTTWKPSQCFTDPFTADEIGNACSTIIWQLAQFTIRHMNGSPHLYHFWIDAGGKGHNGKSTLWELIQRLIKKPAEIGDDDLISSGTTVINCAIEDLEKDYVLAQNITTAYAIVGEESNAATSYIENCAMVKMLSRAQEYTFRQIRQEPFSFCFSGALIQQCNKPPLFAEKSDSMFTHSVNIPFTQSFTDDRAYIKDDYILREEVAEWLAYRLTVELPAYDAYDADALKTLEPFKREMLASGMSTMQALDEIVPGLNMNFMPSELLYDLYLRWCDRNGVTGRGVVSAKTFRDDLEQYGINNEYDIEFTKKSARNSMNDLKEYHPAIMDFAYSPKLSYTNFARMHPVRGVDGYLNTDLFTQQGRGKLWTKGGLKRNTRWQDVKKTAIVAEIDEDANI